MTTINSLLISEREIGVDVQAYDANLPAGNTILVDGDIDAVGGVQSYDADTAKLDVVQTFTAVQTLTDPVIIGAITEDVYTITDGASVDLDPSNGSIQTWTLGANRTATATNFAAGESMLVMVADGTAYTLTWPTMTWVGGSAPTLATSGYSVIELWKVGSTLYGAHVGDVA